MRFNRETLINDRIKLIALFILFGLTINLNANEVKQTHQSNDKEQISRGKAVYKKSNCAFCHSWSGNGQGHPRSPGTAANLRTSVLDRKALTYTIRCGVVGGVMPYHDRMAYRDQRCISNPEELAAELIPQKGKNIQAGDLELLVSFIITSIQGKGDVSFEECETFYKPGSRNCMYLK